MSVRKTGKPRKAPKREILVTGYPGFIGKQLVRKLLQAEPDSTFHLLVQQRFADDADRYIRTCRTQHLDRVHLLVGDIADMHLGLSAAELQHLSRRVTDIYHLAAISYLGVPDETMWRVNVHGTDNLLEVANQALHLKRFVHMSTCYVAGNREGVVTEEELDEGQGFRNTYERTKFEAEKRVRAASARLPITVLRPSVVVGDSRTGEIGRFDGPYMLGILLVASPLTSMPLPGRLLAPLNMVPVDFVVEASYHLSLHPEAVQRTFHLVDPNPLSAHQVVELIAQRAGKKPSRLRISAGLTKTLLRIPGLEKISRGPRQAIDYVNTMAFFNSRNTMALLESSGIRCPPFESYLDALMDYVKNSFEARKRQKEQVEDPLA